MKKKGLTLALISLISMSYLFGCEDGGAIQRTCISNKACIIENGNVIIKDSQEEFDPIFNVGNCSIGITTCETSSSIVQCENFSGPSKEVCDNVDNDCNGQIDEGFDQDEDGFTTCQGDCNDASAGIFPGSLEQCDGVDNDCDGTIDLIEVSCWSGPEDASFEEDSQCRKGTKTCTDGHWGICENQRLPGYEICDSIDNDCDGEVDTDVNISCGPSNQVGACSYGQTVCTGGDGFCVEAVYPQAEMCDNIDNDCDGSTDEDLTQICQTQCGLGEETCSAGQWVDCTAPIPTEEICDGIDNDCNGEVDEGCPCQTGEFQHCQKENMIDRITGELKSCGFGVKYCSDGNWGECEYFGTENETCDNWDNDCDGEIDKIDEPCGSNPQLHGIGQCLLGERTCVEGTWSDCEGNVPPEPEICDNIDNNCDGQIDNGLTPHKEVDLLFVVDGSGSMCNKIQQIVAALTTYAGDFQNSNHRFALVHFPGSGPTSNPRVIANLVTNITNYSNFITALSSLNCTLNGDENLIDTLNAIVTTSIAHSENLQINWRSSAYPYIVMVSDEPPGRWDSQIDVALLANKLQNCAVGSCVGADMYEMYAIVPSSQYFDWEPLVFYQHSRFVDIYPIDQNHYTAGLRTIFRNVCF